MSIFIVCPKCEGKGRVRKHLIFEARCSECHGDGKIQLNRDIDQYIPDPQSQLESVNRMKGRQKDE